MSHVDFEKAHLPKGDALHKDWQQKLLQPKKSGQIEVSKMKSRRKKMQMHFKMQIKSIKKEVVHCPHIAFKPCVHRS